MTQGKKRRRFTLRRSSTLGLRKGIKDQGKKTIFIPQGKAARLPSSNILKKPPQLFMQGKKKERKKGAEEKGIKEQGKNQGIKEPRSESYIISRLASVSP